MLKARFNHGGCFVEIVTSQLANVGLWKDQSIYWKKKILSSTQVDGASPHAVPAFGYDVAGGSEWDWFGKSYYEGERCLKRCRYGVGLFSEQFGFDGNSSAFPIFERKQYLTNACLSIIAIWNFAAKAFF